MSEYYERNKEKIRKRQKIYSDAHKEEGRVRSNEYYHRHKNDTIKEYREDHKDELKQYQADYRADPERKAKAKEYQRLYRLKKKENKE